MLSENDIKEELSYAYVHAVASRAGFGCDRPTKDRDSVDVLILSKGKLSPDSKMMSPVLEIQLKATSIDDSESDVMRFSLPLKNYDELRQFPSMIPRILVVFVMPSDPELWLSCSASELILRKCAYWCNLLGQPASPNKTRVTIKVPKENALTPEALRTLMVKVSQGRELGNVL